MDNNTQADTTLEQRIIQLAAEQASIDISEVTPASLFKEDLGYDSLDVAEFIMELEDEFELSVPDQAAEELKTVQKVVDWVRENT
ncbi:MAG: acyl carrier protein [Planctomycetota bacterium]